jgi:hypothetical protein
MVITLWKSHLASVQDIEMNNNMDDGSTNILKSNLTLVFADHVTLTLDQDEFILSMANQHQAAPSEYQFCKRFASC